MEAARGVLEASAHEDEIRRLVESAISNTQPHAGVLVWKREGRRAIGEEGEPVIAFTVGRAGDFD